MSAAIIKGVSGLFLHAALCAVLVLLLSSCAPRPNRVQAPQRPFSMTPLAPVKSAGSDLRAFLFKWLDLPRLIKMADKEYNRQAVLDHFETLKFDPARLMLRESSEVRVYFIGEGSGYADALCVNIEGVGLDDGVPKLLFPNANTKTPLDAAARLIRKRWIFGQWWFGERSEAEPLLPGDFVDLGSVPAGKTLSFILAVNGEDAYTPVAERNPDKKAHMVGMAVEDSPYVLISFEDMFDLGDSDFEDAVFAVELSNGNVEALLGRFDPWGKVKRLAKLIALMAVLFGTPVGIVAARRATLRRRWGRHCGEAEAFLEEGRPSDALTAARRAERAARSRAEKHRCRELIVAASEGCRDLAGLSELYDTTPEIFARNESAALAIGRAQIETDHLDAYGTLRRAWEKREISAPAWLALDCDAMMKEGREGDARTLLEGVRFAGAEDAPRLARLARLLSGASPAGAEELAARAVTLNPGLAEAHLLRASVLDGHGKFQEAHGAYMGALRLAPEDPVVRDRLAGFYCRMGRFPAALEVLRDGLRPPSIGFVWTKFLFWSRVVRTVPVEWGALEPPPGELRPLIDYLLRLEPERFWNTARFNSIGKLHPVLLDRQEVRWLRTLESLRTGRETEARWLLSFEGSGRESWHPALETALLRVIMYRQTESLGPFQVKTGEKPVPAVPQHPFFARLEEHAQNSIGPLPKALADFLRSDAVFAILCLAAGWTEAGRRLARHAALDDSAPEWAVALWKDVVDL